MNGKTPQCRACGQTCQSFKELALHILKDHKDDQRGNYWAINFLMNKKVHDLPKRIADPDHVKTEYGDENRENASRKISGDNEYVSAQCPSCKVKSRVLLPVEHIQNPYAWKEKGVFMTLCGGCRNKGVKVG